MIRLLVGCCGLVVLLSLMLPAGCSSTECSTKCTDCDKLSRDLRELAEMQGDVPVGRQACGERNDPEGDLPQYRTLCDQLRDCLDEADADGGCDACP